MSKLEYTFAWTRRKKTTGGSVDLSNYYTKPQVDTKISNLNKSLSGTNQLANTNQIAISKLETTTTKNTNKLQELAVEVDSNQSLINDIHNQLSVYISTTNNYFKELDKKLSDEDKKLANRITQNEKDIALLKQSGGSGSGSINTSSFANLYKTNTFQEDNIFNGKVHIYESLSIGDTATIRISGLGIAFSYRPNYDKLEVSFNRQNKTLKYSTEVSQNLDDYDLTHKKYVDTTIADSIDPISQTLDSIKLDNATNTDTINSLKGQVQETNTFVNQLQVQNNQNSTGLLELNKKVTQHQTQIAQNTADILDLKNRPSGGNVDLSNYYTIEQWDSMYQGMEMTGPTPIITDFGKKALLVFQVPTDNLKLNDFIGNIPSEIANWRNIANIESATVNAVNPDSDILSKPLDLLISHYNGRIFIKSYSNLPSDVKHIRFRIWVNKK